MLHKSNIYNSLTSNKANIITITTAYFLSTLFIMFGVGTECYHIMQHPAFLTDWDFFKDFLKQPGGIGEYLSLFIEQFFDTKLGSILLILEILGSAKLLNALINKVVNKEKNNNWFLWLLPLFVSVMCINNVYFAFQIIMQLIIMLLVMNILHSISEKSKMFGVAMAVAAIVIFHCCGPLYLYSFCVSEILIHFCNKDARKIIFIGVAISIALFYPALIYRFVLPLTPKYIFYYPVSQRTILELFQPMVFTFYIVVPLSIISIYLLAKIKQTLIAKYSIITLMIGVLIFVYCQKESKYERFAAKISFESECENWEYVINKSFKCGFYDRTTNFYYNLALAKTATMGRYLFEYPQRLGNEALTIEEPLAGNVSYPSSTLYFHLGQISNSLRYAYESIIYYPNSPYILRRIIDCLIISNRFTEASIFLNQLNRNMLEKSFVTDRRNYIAGKHNCQLSDDYVKEKQQNSVKHDYIMTPALKNFEQLMIANANNQPATDYILCFCLLNNDLENFVNVLTASHYNLKSLPKNYQEALAMYLATTNNPNPKIKEAVIDNEIAKRFTQFTNIAKNVTQASYEEALKQNFGNTYWIYYKFENPMRKKTTIKNSQK